MPTGANNLSGLENNPWAHFNPLNHSQLLAVVKHMSGSCAPYLVHMPGHVHMQEPTFAFLLNSGTICGQGIKQEHTHTTNMSVLVIYCTRSITFYILFYINPPKPLITVTHRPLFLNSNSHWCLHKDNGYVIFSSEADTTLMLPLQNNLHDQTVTYCYSWIRLYMVHPVLKRQGQFLVLVSRRSAEI